MIRVCIKLLKKIIFSILLLYSFNLVSMPTGIIVPINYVTVLFITILGIPALFSFILITVLLF